MTSKGVGKELVRNCQGIDKDFNWLPRFGKAIVWFLKDLVRFWWSSLLISNGFGKEFDWFGQGFNWF